MTDTLTRISYFLASKNLLYSLVMIFPMIFVYEVLGFIHNFDSNLQIRNGADALLRQFFVIFGSQAQLIYGISLFAMFILVVVMNRNVLKDGSIKISFLILMVTESIFWCTILLIIMRLTDIMVLANPMSYDVFEQFYLSVGAGIWEEFIFRLALLAVLIQLFAGVFRYNKNYSVILALLCGGMIFSAFHYLGTFGDFFMWSSFLYRTIAGVFLGAVYLMRGLGITVYTHIFYDMILVTIPVTSNG